jgi:hypothetical protein
VHAETACDAMLELNSSELRSFPTDESLSAAQSLFFTNNSISVRRRVAQQEARGNI